MMNEIWWLFFNMILPLVPVPAVWFSAWVTRGGTPGRNVLFLVRDGQLFFYCTATSSAALGDIFRTFVNRDTRDRVNNLAGASFWTTDCPAWIMTLFLIVLASMFCFSFCVKHKDNPDVLEGRFTWVGVCMIFITVLMVLGFRHQTGLL
jgi:hypothetical protein